MRKPRAEVGHKISNGRGIDPRLVNYVIFIVATTWAVSYLADIAMATYEPPGFIHPVMITVVGGIFGANMFRRNGDK